MVGSCRSGGSSRVRRAGRDFIPAGCGDRCPRVPRWLQPHRKEHHERADDQCPADRADPRALDDRPKLGPLGGVLPGEGT